MATPSGRTMIARNAPRPMIWPAKDADEVLDYSIDFTDRLGDDSISSVAFSLATAAGLVIDDDTHSGPIATVTLSAGTAGSKGKVLCRVTTTDGQTMDETVQLPIRAR